MHRPNRHRTNGDIHGIACPEADSNAESSHLKANEVAQGEDQYGDPRTVECPIFESVVHGAEEERHVTLHLGLATGQ